MHARLESNIAITRWFTQTWPLPCYSCANSKSPRTPKVTDHTNKTGINQNAMLFVRVVSTSLSCHNHCYMMSSSQESEICCCHSIFSRNLVPYTPHTCAHSHILTFSSFRSEPQTSKHVVPQPVLNLFVSVLRALGHFMGVVLAHPVRPLS